MLLLFISTTFWRKIENIFPETPCLDQLKSCFEPCNHSTLDLQLLLPLRIISQTLKQIKLKRVLERHLDVVEVAFSTSSLHIPSLECLKCQFRNI